MGSSSRQSNTTNLSFKILLIGDFGFGKSSLLVSFISNYVDDLAPTICIYFSASFFFFFTLPAFVLSLLIAEKMEENGYGKPWIRVSLMLKIVFWWFLLLGFDFFNSYLKQPKLYWAFVIGSKIRFYLWLLD